MPRFRCEECNRMVTRSPDTGIEYGHSFGGDCASDKPRCSRRPKSVDPTKPGSRQQSREIKP